MVTRSSSRLGSGKSPSGIAATCARQHNYIKKWPRAGETKMGRKIAPGPTELFMQGVYQPTCASLRPESLTRKTPKRLRARNRACARKAQSQSPNLQIPQSIDQSNNRRLEKFHSTPSSTHHSTTTTDHYDFLIQGVENSRPPALRAGM